MLNRKNTVIKKKEKLILKKWIRITLLIVFIFLFIFSCTKIYFWKKDGNKINEIKDKITKNVKIDEKKPNNNAKNVNPPSNKDSDYWKYIKTDMLNVNFDELLKINSDTVGWIKVNGTNVNYPVVQTDNNDFYLNHSYDKSVNKAGWVFLDYRNNINDFDKNTIIYAHGRVDETMFGSLRKTLNKSWYNNKTNHVIKFSTKTQNTLWQVFSVYTIKAESYYITTTFSSDDVFNEFVNTLKNRSIVLFDTKVNKNDKIITLSTCKDSKGTRIVMHAKLIKIENK